MTTPAPSHDLTAILSEDDLAALTQAHDAQPQRLTLSARQEVVAPYPQAAAAISALGDYFFRTDPGALPMTEKDRERGIIAVLAASAIDPGFVLAVHLYWGLSVGLTPKEIADGVLLTSMYAGIPHWAVNATRFGALLRLLKGIIADARAGVAAGTYSSLALALDPLRVLDLIRAQFTFVTAQPR